MWLQGVRIVSIYPFKTFYHQIITLKVAFIIQKFKSFEFAHIPVVKYVKMMYHNPMKSITVKNYCLP